MKIDPRFGILAAVAGGIALGAACALEVRRARQDRRLALKREHKVDLHEWEGEGGNLARQPPPVAPPL